MFTNMLSTVDLVKLVSSPSKILIIPSDVLHKNL